MLRHEKADAGIGNRIVDAYDYGVTTVRYGEYVLEVRRDACTCCISRWSAHAASKYDKDADRCSLCVNPRGRLTDSFIEDMPELSKAQKALDRHGLTRAIPA